MAQLDSHSQTPAGPFPVMCIVRGPPAFLSIYAHFLQVIVTCTLHQEGVYVLDGTFTVTNGGKSAAQFVSDCV